MKEKIILLTPFSIIALLFFPFITTQFGIENEGLGSAIFTISLILLIGLVGLYIFNTIKFIIAKKRNPDMNSSEYCKIKKMIMLISPVGFFISLLINFGTEGGYGYYSNDESVIAFYFLFIFLFLLADIFIFNYKQALKSKSVIFPFIAFLFGIVLIELNPLLILINVSIIELLITLVFFMLQNKITKSIINSINKKQMLISCISLILISVISIGLLTLSNNISKKRSQIILEQFKGKIFEACSFDDFYRGIIFDSSANMATVSKNQEIEDAYYEKLDITFNWFGLGKPVLDGYYNIIYNKNGNIEGIINTTNQKYIITDKIPYYVELYKFIPTRFAYTEKYKTSGMPVNDKLLPYVTQTGIVYANNAAGSVISIDTRENDTLLHSDKNGKLKGYDYMLKPIFLYIEDVPDAILDVNQLLIEWDKHWVYGTIEKTHMSSEFTKGGITYRIVKYTDKNYMEITVKHNHYAKIDLNNYPAKYKEIIKSKSK